MNSYDDTLARQANDLALKWHSADVMGVGISDWEQFSEEDVKGWPADQVVTFLTKLLDLRGMKGLNAAVAQRMGALYGFKDSNNSEVKFAWYKLW